jgi:hypothetical protein
VTDQPKAENGVLFLHPYDEPAQAFVKQRWPFAKVSPFGPGARVDLSDSERGACPGFNDLEGIRGLSSTGPRRVAIGFFCDSIGKAEGIRIVDAGREVMRLLVDWATANPPDPIAWPVAELARKLDVPLEAITKVPRPGRPRIAVALESLLNGGDGADVKDADLKKEALETLGELAIEPATAALVRCLKSADWVVRFHAVRSYARLPRKHGQDGRPALDELLKDEDEGVRESALHGIGELLPSVDFADAELHKQIDAAIKKGLADQDEDVKATAEKLREFRKKVLG